MIRRTGAAGLADPVRSVGPGPAVPLDQVGNPAAGSPGAATLRSGDRNLADGGYGPALCPQFLANS